MTTITAKIRKSDGKLVRMHPDGREEILPKRPIRPMTPEQLDTARLVPRVRTLRRALGLTQEEFALRFHIPLGTLRDWEQGRTEPDQPTRAYLKVIARDPDGVRRALQASSAPPPAD